MAKFEIKQALDAEVFLDVKAFMDESFEFLLQHIETGQSVFCYSEAFNEMLGAFKAHYAYDGSNGFCWLMGYHFKSYMLKMIDWASRDGVIDERMSLSLRRLVQYGNFRVSFVDGRFILRRAE